MAKAKKPEYALVTRVDEALNHLGDLLRLQQQEIFAVAEGGRTLDRIKALERISASHSAAIDGNIAAELTLLREAICPRVAARLTALERKANADAEESTKLERRLELQEREQTRIARSVFGAPKHPLTRAAFIRNTYPKVQAPDLRSSADRVNWAPGALDRLAADVVRDQERDTLNRMLEHAELLSRAARHELIVKLTDLNRS